LRERHESARSKVIDPGLPEKERRNKG